MAALAGSDELSALRDYEIEELIGVGGMARVYRARRREDGAVVALKVPLPEVLDNPVLRERFRAEFRVGSSLDHPNIVRTLALGEEGALYFLVLEYVDGPDLGERLEADGPLPEREAVDLITQVARGLHEAHRHGIIHRDVKPDNVLLTTDGRAKLGDLGLLKDLEADYALTCPNKGLGTPNFIAPEQFTEARHADVRCDVYALGATLYMALTGEMPFQGNSVAATLRLKLNNELRPARSLVPTLSEAVDWAIRRALQVDPQRRQASCLEFIQSLKGGGAAPAASTPGGPCGRRVRPPEERRRSVRYPCTLATVCEVQTSIHAADPVNPEPWPAQVVDLSQAGIGMVLDRRFEPGTGLSILLQAPDQGFKYRSEMRVQRCIRAGGNQWFIGAAFTVALEKGDLRKLV